MKRVMCFDMDDTLYPELDFVLSGFHAVADLLEKRLGLSGMYEELLSAFKDGERLRVFDGALKRRGIEPTTALMQELVQYYRSYPRKLAPYPDVGTTLASLHNRGCNLALLTDGPVISQTVKLEALHLGKFFQLVIYTDALGPGCGKPSPVAYQRVMDTFQAGGQDCVYVGDNPSKDFAAPNALGWFTVRVRRSDALQRKENVGAKILETHYQPRCVISDLSELEACL